MECSEGTAQREIYSIHAYINKEERSQINNPSLHLEELEIGEQTKPKANRRKETVKVRSRGKHYYDPEIPLLGIYLEKTIIQKRYVHGTSLVVQWLRIRLPVQGTRVRALLWEDPTCHGATKPMSHNY